MQPAKNQPNVELFTDGACLGNPGFGGWAFILRHVRSGQKKEGKGGEHGSTNNRMEMTAVIRGLEAMKKPSQIELYSDSEYVVKGITEWMHNWKRFGWKKTVNAKERVKNADLWQRIDDLLKPHTLTAHWVRGHDGHPENERCDALANAAAERIGRTPPPPAPVQKATPSLFSPSSSDGAGGSK